MKVDELPVIITPPELAEFLRTTVNSLAQDRYLGRGVPFIRVGRRVRYARSDVLTYLEANTCQRTDDRQSERLRPARIVEDGAS